MNREPGNSLWIYSLLIFVSRLPFVFDGYGAEEDAWALRLVAERIATTGVYEVSRLPGHPVQELTYSFVWDSGAWIFNLLTASISTIGIHAFMLLLRRLAIPSPGLAGLALAFTPIVYIHSTDSMDYMWAISFVLMAAFAASTGRYVLAGLLLGIACGCRITSGAMLVPLSFVTYLNADEGTRWRALMRLSLSTIFFSALAYLPVFLNYGTGFFTYYEHFPVPGWMKNAYKGSIAVWGLPGLIAVCTAIIVAVFRSKPDASDENSTINQQKLFGKACLITCVLYLVAFIRLPLKPAFLIPLVPFLLAWLAMRMHKPAFQLLTAALFLSCFTFGINLAEKDRGSAVSKQAWVVEADGQAIALDPLSGMVLADRSKRIQRIRHARQLLSSMDSVRDRAVLITGWWQAHLLVLQREQTGFSSQVIIRHYCSEEEMASWQQKGYSIYYLEDQELYNDLRFKGVFTRRYARPWPYSRHV